MREKGRERERPREKKTQRERERVKRLREIVRDDFSVQVEVSMTHTI